jgi:hypothetical protein
MNSIDINIYCVGGEIGFGDASTSDPLGYFIVACGNVQPHTNIIQHTRVVISASPGIVAPTAAACMDIFAKKCDHVRVGMIIHANFGWLLSIAHYIKAKYANMVASDQEEEFLATQLSGYGPTYLQHRISQSRCAAYYMLAG